MGMSLRDRIAAVILKLPQESRKTAEDDLRWFESHAEISTHGLSEILSDPTSDCRLQSIGAWIEEEDLEIKRKEAADALKQVRSRGPAPLQ